MEQFKRRELTQNYFYENEIAAGDTVYLEIPPVSESRHKICDFGYVCEDGISLAVTCSENKDKSELWHEVKNGEGINGAVTCIRLTNTAGAGQKACVTLVME